ncbi:SART-1 family [Tasmannia lanceolata]|uniref:SART-1 family n=1 Tax=Tasmannia lanceolata TaxID=3420 RepID=UPI00406395B2
MDMDLEESRFEARAEKNSAGEVYMDEEIEDLVENEVDLDIKNENGGNSVSKDKDKTRDSGKHRSKDRKKEKKEEKEHRSKDRDKSKTRDTAKDKEHDRIVSREDKGKERERDREREKERSKERTKERDYEHDRYKDKDRERDKDREKERERGKDRGKERERDRVVGKERELDRESERGKERGKEHDRGRERDKERERDRDREKVHNKNEVELEKERERERGKEKDRERGREKERDGARDKEKVKDREREREKGKDKDRGAPERDKGKERIREKDRDKSWEREKHRSKDKEREKVIGKNQDLGYEKDVGKRKEGEKDDELNDDFENDGDIAKRVSKSDTRDGSLPPTLELRDRTVKMKEESLGKKSDGVSEVLSWVTKSRRLEEKMSAERQKALHLSKVFEEQDNIDQEESEDEMAAQHTGKDLAGVKILHGLDKVIEGGAIVLTLKDQNILADGDINEEVDMLENVEIGEQRHRDEAYRAAKKKTGKYEDKFGSDLNPEKTILPQYDDPVGDEGVTLDESGRFNVEAEKKLDELRKRLQGVSTSNQFEDLTSSGKISSDYYTHEEMLEFKKPKKKKKSFRKKEKLDLDALEAEAISAGLGANDLGSRDEKKRQSAKEERENFEAEMRSNAYQLAYAKAEEASRALRQEQTLTIKGVEDENPVFGEDDDDLYKSLEKARKLALKRQDEAAASGPQAVALLAVAGNQSGETHNSTSEEVQENRVVFTEMDEFVWGLQLDEDAEKPEAEDVFKDEEEVPKSFEQDINDEAGGWTEVNETSRDEMVVEEEKDDIIPDKTIHEPAVGKGLSGALQLLKERGTLKESIDWGGRNMDKKKSKLVGIYENDGSKEIRIERTDEFGRIMTPKEAFRMISHKFHGKGPGKMKLEKRMKQYHEELKLKQMKASDTPSQSMERMREAQAHLQTPYLVLSGHVKPGQTSDPRSGFATVEKDHLGSLTPMLGDRKVEHFLGIKRKAEPSNMGPPKKPKT